MASQGNKIEQVTEDSRWPRLVNAFLLFAYNAIQGTDLAHTQKHFGEMTMDNFLCLPAWIRHKYDRIELGDATEALTGTA